MRIASSRRVLLILPLAWCVSWALGAESKPKAGNHMPMGGSRPAPGLKPAGNLKPLADSRQILATFASPGPEHAVNPLWVWNDMLTEQEIRETLRDLAAQKVMQVFVHPRPGLMTPYLGDEWFKLWKVALEEGEKLGMLVWIYDENSYPSGFAGGLVPDQMPESRGRGLSLKESEDAPAVSDDLVAVYQPEGDAYRNITADLKAGRPPAKGKYLVATVVHAPPTPWNAGKTYVDLMYPGVTEKFLDITLGAYQERLGGQLGKRVPGSFTDEPNLRPAGGLPWTPDLPRQFENKWKYSLLDHLPSLVKDTGPYRQVRHDYIWILNKLFIERWARPYHDRCEKLGIQFTGHYWEHDWPMCLAVPDNMAMYAWHQLPSIDNLMNTYSEDLHAQFGNTRTVRELASVANQMGRARTLCEAYGAGGWDLRFEDMKRIGDWLYVLGVNMLDPHLSYITIRGARKRDHPQSFSYHEPWWEAYHISAEYFARLSVAMSAGLQLNDVLVLEPTTTAWLYNNDTANERLQKVGKSFEAFIREWEQNQVEYDLGSEDILARHGSVDAKGKALVVGKRGYRVVVVPPETENLEGTTVDLLGEFIKAGGTVLCCGEAPALVDGRPSDRVKQVAVPGSLWVRMPAKQVMAAVRGRQWVAGLKIVPSTDTPGQLYHQRRALADGDLLFLVNTRLDGPAKGTITTLRGMEKWNLETGRTEPVSAERVGKKVEMKFELPPAGSLLLFVRKANQEPTSIPPAKATGIAAAGPMEIKRLDPNVLVLDYADVVCGQEVRKNALATKAANWLFARHGVGDRNPWDRAVQFKDELIRKTFPADSGFEASYRFTIVDRVPASLAAVIERPDLYAVTCNGRPVAPNAAPVAGAFPAGGWWLDRSFGRIDIAGAAKVGDNVLTVKASPFTMFHELEAAYLIGDFGLQPVESGFVIVPEQPLKPGPWNEQGCRLYGQRVSYRQKFDVGEKKGSYRVELPAWYGSVAKVVVNGKEAGFIGWQPWQCDVTAQVISGSNEVEVIVYGTLRNTLGPCHKPNLGLAWPGMWDDAPEAGPPAGKNYVSVGYGLFKPFELKNQP